MKEQQITGVVCQWCERVVRAGGDRLELVTCLQCAQTFGATFRHGGLSSRRSATGGHGRMVTSGS
jgi:hypothetical protein